MRSLFRVIFSIIILTSFSLFQDAKVSMAKENYLTVTFKPDVNEKYIKVLNLMTGTKIVNKIDDNAYSLKMLREGDSEMVNRYLQLFSLIPDVINVSSEQVKSTKVKAGQLIPGVIIVRFKNNTKRVDIIELEKKYKTKTSQISSSLNLYKVKLPFRLNVEKAIKLFNQEKIVEYAEADRVMTIQKNKNTFISMNSEVNPGALSITFKPGYKDLAVNLFNLVYDTNLIEQKHNGSFLFKLSENTNTNSALNALKLCPYISDIKIFQRNN